MIFQPWFGSHKSTADQSHRVRRNCGGKDAKSPPQRIFIVKPGSRLPERGLGPYSTRKRCHTSEATCYFSGDRAACPTTQSEQHRRLLSAPQRRFACGVGDRLNRVSCQMLMLSAPGQQDGRRQARQKNHGLGPLDRPVAEFHIKRPRFTLRDTDSCPDLAFVERFRKVRRVSFAALPTSWLGRHYRGQGTSKTPVANGGGGR
jgi:hypothetical protein